jgi:4-diphosphocytidyl-2-C-methyl-D-erythritol kinase
VILFPNCKINLGLHITQKRPDGFHNLQTFFYPVPITDALEIIVQENREAPFQFTLSGPPIDAVSDNICVKAYHLLKQDFKELPAVKMHLHKAVPVGAGLGGGSADGAFTLLLLNKKFNLQLSEQQLLDYALQLGSDCPFFIKNVPCFATGRGEILEPMPLDLSLYKLVLVNPGLHINTGWAFSQLQPKAPAQSLSEIIQLPVNDWKHSLTNDFEEPIFLHYPAIQQIKKELYAAGAVYASMSGTGSTIFALFEKETQPALSFPAHYFVKECYLSGK